MTITKAQTRGVAPAPAKVRGDDPTLRDPVRAGTPPDDDDLDPEALSEIEPDGDDADSEEKSRKRRRPKPENVTECDDGSVLIRLRYPLEPAQDDPDGTDITKVRVPAKVFVRHLRQASKDLDGSFYDAQARLLSAVCRVPLAIVDRLDLRDFDQIGEYVKRVTNPPT